MYPEIPVLYRPAPGRSRWLAGATLSAAILGACTFAPGGLVEPGADATQPPGDGRPVDAAVGTDTIVAIDAAPDADPGPARPRDVVHVPEAGWEEGDFPDVTWTDDVTIDTSSGDFTGPGTGGLALFSAQQTPSGPELALLHVGNLTVNDGVEVRVTGGRPLVIISAGSITLNGVIDAGADRQAPGAGGAGPGQGDGRGAAGTHLDGQSNDSGGSGAGHGTAGARGGNGCSDDGNDNPLCGVGQAAVGPAGGAGYGDAPITELTGGSGGGRGGEGDGSCAGGDGGAGGGAVQLYAVATITIGASGGISVGGGGGEGGEGRAGSFGSPGCAASGGGGGGSGGAVYLQARRIELAGTLAANGGGGAAGATGGGDSNRGASGANGALSATPAAGGPDATDGGSAGGSGGAGTTAPTPGVDDDSNGGGGGGAVGHIVLHCTEFEGSGVTSPDAFRTPGCS